jgi:hypothetical protein
MGHFVVNLRDNFNYVRWGKIEHSLPDFAQTMDAGNCASGFGAFASDAENELGHNMIKVQVGCDFVHLFFDFWSGEVFYWHSLIFRLGDVAFGVKKVTRNP